MLYFTLICEKDILLLDSIEHGQLNKGFEQNNTVTMSTIHNNMVLI